MVSRRNDKKRSPAEKRREQWQKRKDFNCMETKEYFEKVMQDFRSAMPLGSSKNQHRNGRSLRKYCQNEGIEEEKTQPKSVWQVSHLRLESPDGGFLIRFAGY